MISKEEITNHIVNNLQVSTVGFTEPVIPIEDIKHYREFLDTNQYGNMLWMKTRQVLRENPKLLLPTAQTAVVLGFNYLHHPDSKDYDISIYADQKIDYHKWVHKKAKQVAKYLDSLQEGSESRFFVDSAPILEKVLAKETSLGWQGKHTCIVSRKFGNWLFLSVILTSLKIEPDKPHKDFCGTCTKCMDACPTQALDEPYKLNVKKCIAYLTIEHKDKIEDKLQSKFSNKIFGCDDCLNACHFNRFEKRSVYEEAEQNALYPNSIKEFLKLKPEEFLEAFKSTPIKRTGHKLLLRNVLIACANSQDTSLIKYIVPYCSYPDDNIRDLSVKAIFSLLNPA